MTRCVYCEHIIWPWQRMGWLVVSTSLRVWWHSRCREAAYLP